jgi:hypothetical protein
MMAAERARPWFTRQAQFGVRAIALDPNLQGCDPDPWQGEPLGPGVYIWRIEFTDEEAARVFDMARCIGRGQYSYGPGLAVSRHADAAQGWAEAEAWLREDVDTPPLPPSAPMP